MGRPGDARGVSGGVILRRLDWANRMTREIQGVTHKLVSSLRSCCHTAARHCTLFVAFAAVSCAHVIQYFVLFHPLSHAFARANTLKCNRQITHKASHKHNRHGTKTMHSIRSVCSGIQRPRYYVCFIPTELTFAMVSSAHVTLMLCLIACHTRSLESKQSKNHG